MAKNNFENEEQGELVKDALKKWIMAVPNNSVDEPSLRLTMEMFTEEEFGTIHVLSDVGYDLYADRNRILTFWADYGDDGGPITFIAVFQDNFDYEKKDWEGNYELSWASYHFDTIWSRYFDRHG